MNTTAHSEVMSGLVYSVDLAKNVFQVHTFDRHGQCIARQRVSRRKFAAKFTSPHCKRGVIVMEACGSSHYWGRRFTELGYRTHLVPPQFVAKQRIGNKNDGNDADTIYAVYKDKRVRPVPVKTLEQQDLQARHRFRERLIHQRTQCINQIRGLLAERGLVDKGGRAGLDALLLRLNQDDHAQVTDDLRYTVAVMAEQLQQLDEHIRTSEKGLQQAEKASVPSQLIRSVHGVGLITATAVAAEYGMDLRRFRDSRQFAANIGITPGEHSSGEKQRPGHITKRGNPYLRKLLVQGAQTIANNCHRHDDPLSLLAQRLFAANKPRSTVIVALANRMARTIYAVIKHREPYRTSSHPQIADAA